MSALRLSAAIVGLSACACATGAQAQNPSDLIYSRVKPCRIFDTTKTTRIPASSGRSFLISGPGDFAPQGGTAAGCGVPASAQAVTLNITAINAAAAGSLTAMGYTQTVAAMTLRYPVGAPEGAGGIVDLTQSRITLKTTNTVNAIGDVTGYFAPQLRAYVNTDGTLAAGSRVVSSARAGVGSYYVAFDRNVRGCVPNVNADIGAKTASAFISPNNNTADVYVTTFDAAGNPIDYYFNLTVHC